MMVAGEEGAGDDDAMTSVNGDTTGVMSWEAVTICKQMMR
jgi:hypothetical protein